MKINLFFCNKSVVPEFKKINNWIQHFFQRPVNLVGFFVALYVMFVTTSLSPIKPYVKSVLGIQQKTGMSKSDSLHKDIARFTNEKIQDNDVVLMFPFENIDFEFYTNHKVFVHSGNLFDYVPEHIDMRSFFRAKKCNLGSLAWNPDSGQGWMHLNSQLFC